MVLNGRKRNAALLRRSDVANSLEESVLVPYHALVDVCGGVGKTLYLPSLSSKKSVEIRSNCERKGSKISVLVSGGDEVRERGEGKGKTHPC